MISIYNLKPKFQKILSPLLFALHKRGVSPNAITTSAILLSLIIGILLWNVKYFSWTVLAVPIGLFIRMALNALDGMMAKTFDLKSKTGEILNEAGDVVSDIFIYFPLIQLNLSQPYFIVLFVMLSILNEFAGVLAKAISGIRRYEGPMGKSDRAFFVGLYCLLFFLKIPVAEFANLIFGIGCGLILISTYLRLKNSLK